MTPLSFAIVTPTYRNDLDRARLLIESVRRHAPDLDHYLFIERRDVAMFEPLLGPRTHLRIVNDIVPSWVFRIPGMPGFWMSLRTLPIRNWIFQQIIKLSIAEQIPEDVFFVTDSDVLFTRHFDPASLVRDGKVPLFMETGQAGLIKDNDRWHNVACRLLGLPEQPVHDTNFIGQVICWRRDHALALRQYLRDRHGGRSVLRILARELAFAEYILYGLFVTRVLGERSGHWIDDQHRTLCHWQEVELDEAGLQALKARAEPHHHAVMVSAKSRTPVDLVRKVFWPDRSASA
jgi:hypothetical protein